MLTAVIPGKIQEAKASFAQAMAGCRVETDALGAVCYDVEARRLSKHSSRGRGERATTGCWDLPGKGKEEKKRVKKQGSPWGTGNQACGGEAELRMDEEERDRVS
jgi:hypothetical protein